MLQNRDYTLIIDKSGSMATPDQKGGKTRWFIAQESTLALASKCEQLDPDGITIYLFSGKFKRFENVTASKVLQIFQENDPAGTTDLAGVLKHATDDYFQRKAAGQTKENGDIILVVTDGEPDDRKAVMKVIIEASRRMDKDEELGISFIQVGNDPQAKRFLKILDDELQNAGAKFDICDTVTMDDMEDMSLSEVLLNAIND
ncbi:MAG: VWA domain-containing protein [Nostocales cyanobacterium]|nr:MAG: VWA domain-containing protein [Nostocales cyanobacterium]TAF14475.1 MAG: VWA domain-containing protein [Nostocales cyanobacterium]